MSEERGQPQSSAEQIGAAIGRRAARLLREARPAAENLAAQALPEIEKFGRKALDFAQEHEGELKDTAVKLARMRLTGPVGMFVDALARPPATEEAQKTFAIECAHCGAANPTVARFCNQCGKGLAT